MELTTKRLRLRRVRPDDVDLVLSVFDDPEVYRYIGGGNAPTRERMSKSVANICRLWDERGFGSFIARLAASERTTGSDLIGVCLLMPIARSGSDSSDLDQRGPEIEIGYWLPKRVWGMGFATEMATAVLGWAMSEAGPGLERVIGVTHPENAASKRVLEKMGMQACGETDRYYGAVTSLFVTG